MRITFIVLAVAALLALGTGSAVARPAPADTPGAALQHRYVGRDLVAVSPDSQVVATDARRSSAVPSAPAPAAGFDWTDAGVGAGLLAALLGLSAGVVLIRRHRPLAAR